LNLKKNPRIKKQELSIKRFTYYIILNTLFCVWYIYHHDVTGIKGVKSGDIVTLIGKDGKEQISAEELAAHAQTTAYELLTRLNPRMGHVLV
jgi:hypothetical protein